MAEAHRQVKGRGLGITSGSAEVVPRCKIQQKLSGHLVSVAGSVVDGGAAVDVRGEGGGAREVAEEVGHTTVCVSVCVCVCVCEGMCVCVSVCGELRVPRDPLHGIPCMH